MFGHIKLAQPYHFLLLKCLYQTWKASDHVCVYWRYQFCLFLWFCYWNCLSFCFSLYYFNIPVPYQFDFLSGSNIRLINENANRKILPAHSITGSKLEEARQNITVHLEERLYCFATTIEAISLKLDVCSSLFFILTSCLEVTSVNLPLIFYRPIICQIIKQID